MSLTSKASMGEVTRIRNASAVPKTARMPPTWIILSRIWSIDPLDGKFESGLVLGPITTLLKALEQISNPCIFVFYA